MSYSSIDLKNNLESLNISEKARMVISSPDMLGLSITMISIMIILTPLIVNEYDVYGLKDFSMNLIDFENPDSKNESKTITTVIDGKSHNITVKLIVEQKAKYPNSY